jgi:hypothetical protein
MDWMEVARAWRSGVERGGIWMWSEVVFRVVYCVRCAVCG